MVEENGSNLLGLDWSDQFGLTNGGTSALQTSTTEPPAAEGDSHAKVVHDDRFSTLKKKFGNVFKAGQVHQSQSSDKTQRQRFSSLALSRLR